jgi:hypothetical protein
VSEDKHLIARFFESDLSPTEADALRRRLEADPKLKAEFGAQAALHGMLGPATEDDLFTERVAERFSDTVKQADEQQFGHSVQRRIRKALFRRRVSWAAAALLMLTAGLLTWMQLPEPVATVSRVESSSTTLTWVAGDKLSSGDALKFASGLVELDLRGRGRMIVEGPADIEFTGPTGAVLRKGRILLRVTPAGHGYRLETPRGSLVDLGTEFGVSVDEQTGQVETHVLEGEVKAIPNKGGEQILLRHDEGLKQTGDLNVRIPADRGSFYASLPPVRRGSPAMIHWNMDTNGTSSVQANAKGFGKEGLDLKFLDKRGSASPTTSDGPFGAAVSFDGEQLFGESEFKGISGQSPRTVALWVKVPSDFIKIQGFAMVSWGTWARDSPGSVWQISVNPSQFEGSVGRLRIGTHLGAAIGRTDLRDDRWHHVAVVLYPAENPDFGQHVLLFVDGEVEPVSNRILGEIDTSTRDASHGVWLGRNINIDNDFKFFRGGLDEVYIFDAALTQEEIRRLMTHNEPPK